MWFHPEGTNPSGPVGDHQLAHQASQLTHPRRLQPWASRLLRLQFATGAWVTESIEGDIAVLSFYLKN